MQHNGAEHNLIQIHSMSHSFRNMSWCLIIWMILTKTEEEHNQSTLCSYNSTQHKTVQFCTTLTFDPLRSSIKSRNTQMYLSCEVLSEYHASFQMQQLTRSPFLVFVSTFSFYSSVCLCVCQLVPFHKGGQGSIFWRQSPASQVFATNISHLHSIPTTFCEQSATR